MLYYSNCVHYFLWIIIMIALFDCFVCVHLFLHCAVITLHFSTSLIYGACIFFSFSSLILYIIFYIFLYIVLFPHYIDVYSMFALWHSMTHYHYRGMQHYILTHHSVYLVQFKYAPDLYIGFILERYPYSLNWCSLYICRGIW